MAKEKCTSKEVMWDLGGKSELGLVNCSEGPHLCPVWGASPDISQQLGRLQRVKIQTGVWPATATPSLSVYDSGSPIIVKYVPTIYFKNDATREPEILWPDRYVLCRSLMFA